MSTWNTKRLGEIATIISGGTPSTDVNEYWNGNIGWVTPADLSNYKFRYIARGERNITEEGLSHSSACLLPKNTVLLSSRAPIGYVAIAENEITTNQGFKNLICRENKANFRFIYYWLSHNTESLKNFATGATFPELSSTRIKKIKALLPDVPTQKRIADILSAYDDLIENNNKRIALLEKAAQELYKEWFVRFRFPGHETAEFENGLPKEWDYIRFGKAIEIIDSDRGTNYPKQEEFYGDGHCLFLNAGNVKKTGFDFSAVSFISEEKDRLLRKGKLKRGDVVLTTRGTVGNSAFYNDFVPFEHIRINSGMVILRDLGCVSPEYVYCLLNSPYMLRSMELYASGSAQPQLPIKDMRRIKIINPDDDTMRIFTEKVQKHYNLIALLVSNNQNLAKQRDLLLPRLMSGKLEV
ncbi:MAG: hypothetical protein GX800_02980 [Clostridiaceae bacterium]|nr:hypothetical protein [Clostridiaceae bacterium]